MSRDSRDLAQLHDEIDSLRETVAMLARRERRRRWARAAAVAVILIPATAYAAQIVIPNVFSNGTVADANEVNANFDALTTESNAQDTRLSSLEGSTSSSVANCTLQPFANNWDGVLNFICPAGQTVGGVYSIHDNSVEDRRFRFYCCDIERD